VSATRLLILGLVRWAQPVHGYDVRRELLSWNADQWANVAPGSIYHALKKLTDDGLLREVATEQVGGRPARTKYEMTEEGERVFQDLLREYWWELKQGSDPFFAAFALLPALPRREAVAALRKRAAMLRGTAQGLRASLDNGWLEEVKPPHVAEMFRLWMARAETDAVWCEGVAERVESGELPTEGVE
jgi:DNA-binding PadR family transcriptional regulator